MTLTSPTPVPEPRRDADRLPPPIVTYCPPCTAFPPVKSEDRTPIEVWCTTHNRRRYDEPVPVERRARPAPMPARHRWIERLFRHRP